MIWGEELPIFGSTPNCSFVGPCSCFFFPGIWKFSHDLLLDKAVFGRISGAWLSFVILRQVS